MALRSDIKDAQRNIAALDAAHARASAALDTAVARRSEVIADEDSRVATARKRVEQTVANMARQLSPDLTSRLLDIPLADVRRITRAHLRTATSDRRPAVGRGRGPDGRPR